MAHTAYGLLAVMLDGVSCAFVTVVSIMADLSRKNLTTTQTIIVSHQMIFTFPPYPLLLIY